MSDRLSTGSWVANIMNIQMLLLVMMGVSACAHNTLHMQARKHDEKNREAAMGLAREWALKDYEFLGIRFFEPLDEQLGYRLVSEGIALREFAKEFPGELFPIRTVVVDSEGTVVGLKAIHPVRGSEVEPRAFMQGVISGLERRMGPIVETDDLFYFVSFRSPRRFVEDYVRENSLSSLRAKYEYNIRPDNFKPDGKLSFLVLSAHRRAEGYSILLYIQSRRGAALEKQEEEHRAKEMEGILFGE